MLMFCSSVLRSCHIVFHSSGVILDSHQQCIGFQQFLCILTNTCYFLLVFLCLFFTVTQMGVRWRRLHLSRGHEVREAGENYG
jgi:hypothetical protein